MTRVFAYSAALAAILFFGWLILDRGPGPDPRARAVVGFLDYYKQFEGMPEEEVNARLREQAAERKRKALAVVEPIDLSATTWPEYPHPAVVNAITYTARRGLHRYLDRSAGELRSELAHRHGAAGGARGRRRRRGAAAQLGRLRADGRPARRARDALAQLRPLPGDGAPRPRARRARAGLRRRRGAQRGQRAHAGRRAVLARTTPPASSCRSRRAARASSGAARARGRPARRGAGGLRRRPAGRRVAGAARRASRGCCASARSPRPGAWRGCASATRWAAPDPRRCWSSSRPSWASTSSRRRARWRRCARPSISWRGGWSACAASARGC